MAAHSRDFSDFFLREPITISTGEGTAWVSLSAAVIGLDPREMHLALASQPKDPERFAPGQLVRVRPMDGSAVRAQVVTLELRTTPRMVLRPAVTAGANNHGRAFNRVLTSLPATFVSAVVAGRALRFRVRVLDLSGGGARLRSSQPMPAGDPLQLSLPVLEPEEMLTVPAVVSWVAPLHDSWQVGVRFGELQPAVRDRIVRTVFLLEVRQRTVPATAARSSQP